MSHLAPYEYESWQDVFGREFKKDDYILYPIYRNGQYEVGMGVARVISIRRHAPSGVKYQNRVREKELEVALVVCPLVKQHYHWKMPLDPPKADKVLLRNLGRVIALTKDMARDLVDLTSISEQEVEYLAG